MAIAAAYCCQLSLLLYVFLSISEPLFRLMCMFDCILVIIFLVVCIFSTLCMLVKLSEFYRGVERHKINLNRKGMRRRIHFTSFCILPQLWLHQSVASLLHNQVWWNKEIFQ